MRTLMLVSLLSLTACGAGFSDPPTALCPTLYRYSEAFQLRAAEEIESLGEGSATEVLVTDYGAVRAEIRACRK